jgi:uncharacterized protein with LGFP repeats
MPDVTVQPVSAPANRARRFKTVVELRPTTFGKVVTDIEKKHVTLGGDSGLLGAAKGAEQPAAQGGRFREYDGGVIYWSSPTGAREVHGAILQLWSQLGRERGFLGYPLTDETTTPDELGRFSHFQGGSIYWTPATGAHEVHGAIRDLWAALGWEQSRLGYPLTDELATADGVGRFVNFQGGQIAWSPQLGAAVSALSDPGGTAGGPGLQPLSHDHPEGSSPQVRRRLSVAAAMQLTDHETFGSNERSSAEKSEEAVLTNEQPQRVLTLIDGAGGEMRVELVLTAKAKDNGDVLVDGVAVLYEGTSEQTDDRDGDETFEVLVPRDSFTSQSIRVRNEDEGDDFADIQMTFNNSAI